MPSVLLVGAFGQGNPGDEALCAAFVTALGAADVVVASGDPGATARRHGVRAIADSPAAVARELRRCDAVVVGGGTVFKTLRRSTSRRPTSLLRNACLLTAAAKATGKHVAFVGVGAGDLHGRLARALARSLVRRVDLLVLRDEESASALAAVGAPAPFWIGADPAWVLQPDVMDRSGTPAARDGVTVALSHHAGDDRLFTALAAAIAPLGEHQQIRLQPWQAGDVEIAARLRSRLGSDATIVEAPADLDAATATFAGDRLVVALRFHALVAAARAGTPFLAVAHEPKLAGLSRRLDQASVPVHAGAEVFAAALARALDAEPPSATAVAGEVAAAEHTMQLLRLLLDRGEIDEPSSLAALPLSAGGGMW
jgi:polysaccharide pyruvyl transferase CsaB